MGESFGGSSYADAGAAMRTEKKKKRKNEKKQQHAQRPIVPLLHPLGGAGGNIKNGDDLPPSLGPLPPGPHPPHRPTGHVQRSHLVANPDDEDDEQSDERDDELAAEQAEGDAAGGVLVEALANYTNPRPGSPGHPDPD